MRFWAKLGLIFAENKVCRYQKWTVPVMQNALELHDKFSQDESQAAGPDPLPTLHASEQPPCQQSSVAPTLLQGPSSPVPLEPATQQGGHASDKPWSDSASLHSDEAPDGQDNLPSSSPHQQKQHQDDKQLTGDQPHQADDLDEGQADPSGTSDGTNPDIADQPRQPSGNTCSALPCLLHVLQRLRHMDSIEGSTQTFQAAGHEACVIMEPAPEPQPRKLHCSVDISHADDSDANQLQEQPSHRQQQQQEPINDEVASAGWVPGHCTPPEPDSMAMATDEAPEGCVSQPDQPEASSDALLDWSPPLPAETPEPAVFEALAASQAVPAAPDEAATTEEAEVAPLVTEPCQVELPPLPAMSISVMSIMSHVSPAGTPTSKQRQPAELAICEEAPVPDLQHHKRLDFGSLTPSQGVSSEASHQKAVLELSRHLQPSTEPLSPDSDTPMAGLGASNADAEPTATFVPAAFTQPPEVMILSSDQLQHDGVTDAHMRTQAIWCDRCYTEGTRNCHGNDRFRWA